MKKRQNGIKKRAKDKRGRSITKGLLDGLLMVTVAVAVFFVYQWLHQSEEESVADKPQKTVMRQEVPDPPLANDMEKAPDPPARQGGTIEFLYMRHGSGDRDDGGDTTSHSKPAPTGTQERGGWSNQLESIGEQNKDPVAQQGPEYSDAEPPRVLSIDGFPEKVTSGSQLEIQVRARDNLSGVRSISGSLRSPSGKASMPFGCIATGDPELFLATVQVPERAEMGIWSVKSLRLTDNVHNTRRYREPDTAISGGVFEVVDSDSDSVPPQIMAFTVEPREVQGGETIHVIVTVQDEKSSVTRVIGAFLSPSGNARLSFSCRDKQGDDTLAGQISVPKDAESGDWVLNYVRAEDEAKNAQNFFPKDYPDVLGDAAIRIYAAGSDSEPPSLDDITVTPVTVSYQENVDISILASDDLSGISRVSGRVRSPSGKAFIPFTSTYDSFDDIYRAQIKIKNNSEVGTWRVEYVRTQDEARNQAVYYYHNNPYVKEAVFEVIGE